jgi:hypothetical protein
MSTTNLMKIYSFSKNNSTKLDSSLMELMRIMTERRKPNQELAFLEARKL